MKQIHKSTILVISIFILNLSFSGSAVAEYRLHNAMNSSHGGNGSYYKARYRSNRYCPQNRSNKYSGYSNYSSRRNRYSNYRKPCHKVSKINYDGHTVAGTMCYNKYGRGYIVSGSRYHVD